MNIILDFVYRDIMTLHKCCTRLLCLVTDDYTKSHPCVIVLTSMLRRLRHLSLLPHEWSAFEVILDKLDWINEWKYGFRGTDKKTKYLCHMLKKLTCYRKKPVLHIKLTLSLDCGASHNKEKDLIMVKVIIMMIQLTI